MLNDYDLYAIFWIGLFSCIAISNIASNLQPRIIRENDNIDNEITKEAEVNS